MLDFQFITYCWYWYSVFGGILLNPKSSFLNSFAKEIIDFVIGQQFSNTMSLSSPVICPPGFDCAFANSCPSPFIECPPGFLCSSYADMEEKKEIDYSYALYKSLFGGTGDVVVTPNNARKFIDPDRAIQNACLKGFYCPDATTIKVNTKSMLLGFSRLFCRLTYIYHVCFVVSCMYGIL